MVNAHLPCRKTAMHFHLVAGCSCGGCASQHGDQRRCAHSETLCEHLPLQLEQAVSRQVGWNMHCKAG